MKLNEKFHIGPHNIIPELKSYDTRMSMPEPIIQLPVPLCI